MTTIALDTKVAWKFKLRATIARLVKSLLTGQPKFVGTPLQEEHRVLSHIMLRQP